MEGPEIDNRPGTGMKSGHRGTIDTPLRRPRRWRGFLNSRQSAHLGDQSESDLRLLDEEAIGLADRTEEGGSIGVGNCSIIEDAAEGRHTGGALRTSHTKGAIVEARVDQSTEQVRPGHSS